MSERESVTTRGPEQRPPGEEAPTVAHAASIAALAFADSDGAKQWVKGLPFGNVAQLYDALQGQLRALTAAQFSPRERATFAEIFREQVVHLHTELARRYAGKPQPAIDRELEAADHAISLWHSLWEQYSACLKPLLEGDPELAGVKPKLLQRGLYVGKQLILTHGLARRAVPSSLWQELHAYHRLAEMLECAVTAVTDELIANGVGISCYSTYTHALLLSLADPYAMTVRQIELTDRWLAMWSRKVFPYPLPRDNEGPMFVVDLDGAEGATAIAAAPRKPGAADRFAYPGKLVTSVRGRIKHLQNGANPAELLLGSDCSVEQCLALLRHLDRAWSGKPRPTAGGRLDTVSLCAGGVGAAYFRISGRTFERKDPLGRKSTQNAKHLQTLAALTDYDRGREEAERTWVWERWQGAYDWLEAQLFRGPGEHRWQLDQLAVVRDDERVRLGYSTRVALEMNSDLAVSLRMWPGTPRAIAVRPASMTTEEPPIPVVILGEAPDEPASLILPPRTFNPSRVLRSLDGVPERRFRLTRLLQRGIDFERAAFEETT